MSSDGFFGPEDDFDSAALEQLDAIEAAHFSPKRQPPSAARRSPATSPVLRLPKASGSKLPNDSSFYDLSFEIDETDYAQLDTFIADAYEGKAKPVAGPSRTSSANKLQTTLFGDILPPTASSVHNKPRSQVERTKSAPRALFGQQAKKTKQWDHTQFSATGFRKEKPAKGKGKGRDENEEEETVEFEQFPAPFISSDWVSKLHSCVYYLMFYHAGLSDYRPPKPMKVQADLLEAKHWIYPLNRPKRDYQYNIVKNALFENTLVALPTGLGKTFIAGVVMLNYYRWFPEGKVIFVAPTKPLVAQQISACHEVCGIPGSHSIEMNGEIPAATRNRYWADKRVFFMTPQTLMNDLLTENCDVRDIVLLVVDEAHRASGDSSYNQVIRFLMAKNPHFRVLALTATPGNSVDSIQSLVDGLHISHIEIRNEESLDLKAYIHKKVFHAHVISPDENLGKLRDLLAKTMENLMKPLRNAGLLFPGDNAIKMHPYRTQSLMSNKQASRFYSTLSMLSMLARAMLYLVAGSYHTCYALVAPLMTDNDEIVNGKKKPGSNKKFKENKDFRAFMQEFELQRERGFDMHPKIEKLKSILIQHFGLAIPEEEGSDDDTKVMVFSTYRDVVEEIVKELERERPLIRATRFIGQANSKQGGKGMNQKEQLDVIKRFKKGEFNVLVATCIGEEGLDIGELDMTVCYDADKAPTRMIQRFGRTGRKRQGTIHALLAEGREEQNIEKAEATYKEVQKVVNKGELYELYGDVERLMPDHIVPQCVEKVVEIEEYVREERRKKGSPKQGTKRKRNDAVERNIPDGANTGFVSVRDLVVKGSKKKKKEQPLKNLEEIMAEGDNESDEEIESGRIDLLPRRTQSAAAGQPSEKQAPKAKLKKSATSVPGKKAAKPRKKKSLQPTSSQLSQMGVDDSDDLDIESGIIAPTLKSQLQAEQQARSSKQLPRSSPTPEPPSPIKPASKIIDRSLIELTDSEHEDSGPVNWGDEEDLPTFDNEMDMDTQTDQNMSWLVDDDDDAQYDFEIVNSSPVAPKPSKHPAPTLERMQIGDESLEISGLTRVDEEVIPDSDPFQPMPVLNDFVEIVEPLHRFTKKVLAKRTTLSASFQPSSVLLSPSRKSNTPETSTRFASFSKVKLSPALSWPSSPVYKASPKGKGKMLPPALPKRILESPGSTSAEMPEPTYPVRPLGRAPKRRRVILDEPESPAADLEMPPPSQRRLHRMESTPQRDASAAAKKAKKHKRALPSLLARDVNPYFDGEADHSGDEVSEGYSDEDEESESDRLFIKDSPATQVSQSYDQSLIYRRSLMTQAPGKGSPPMFVNGPVRARPFGRMNPRGRFLPSSSPPPPDEELDDYHVGSFVVADDEEISYEI